MNRDDVIAAVAQGWCTPENENKVMDVDLAMAIVENTMALDWDTRKNTGEDD